MTGYLEVCAQEACEGGNTDVAVVALSSILRQRSQSTSDSVYVIYEFLVVNYCGWGINKHY
jgi:hypothetical protein